MEMIKEMGNMALLLNVYGINLENLYQYRFNFMRLLCTAFISIFVFILLLNNSYAECPSIDDLRKHVVFLEIKFNGQTNSATGVLVSDKGLMITSFDLVGKLGINPLQVEPKDYAISLKTNKNSSDAYKAHIIGHHQQRGLLLLKADPDDISQMGLSSSMIGQTPKDTGTEVCTIGYGSSGKPEIPSEIIKIVQNDLNVLEQCLLTTNFTFKGDLKGSPIFDKDQKLIGIASSHHTGDGIFKFFVPIEYADILIPHIFISDLRKELRKQIEWTKMVGKKDKCDFAASYKKMLSGQFPFIKDASCEVRVKLFDTTNKLLNKKQLSGVPKDEVHTSPIISAPMTQQRYGFFCLDEIIKPYIINLIGQDIYKKVTTIKLQIILSSISLVDDEKGSYTPIEDEIYFDPIEESIDSFRRGR